MAEGSKAVYGSGIVDKVVVPALVAPVLAFVAGGLAILVAYRIVGRQRPGPVARGFRLGQIVSASLLSLSHGTNDAQKTMGIIFLALVANGNLAADADVPTWVVVSAASAIALGTYVGGWRIIRTMGSRIIKMDPAQGFAAQGVGATVIMAASHVGFPLSTTHVISGAIMGTGAAKRISAVRWGVAGNIVIAWVLTLPAVRRRRRGHVRRRGAAGQRRRRPGRRLGRAAGRAGARAGPAPRRRPDADGGGLMPVLAVDTGLLWQVIWVSLVAGVGISALFSLVILAGARAGDARRAGQGGAAAAYAALGLVAFLLFAVGVVLGVQTMITK